MNYLRVSFWFNMNFNIFKKNKLSERTLNRYNRKSMKFHRAFNCAFINSLWIIKYNWVSSERTQKKKTFKILWVRIIRYLKCCLIFVTPCMIFNLFLFKFHASRIFFFEKIFNKRKIILKFIWQVSIHNHTIML